MLRIADDLAARLESEFGLTLPRRTRCYATRPQVVEAITGTAGAAYRRTVMVGFEERHLSTFAMTAAHELAHVLAGRLGPYPPPFKGEGFACYAAWRIGACKRPCGLPVHYHLAWLLGVGVKPSLEELWERADYTAEMYDLAWSLAAFLADRFDRERYFDFYRSGALTLPERVESALGMPVEKLERDWFEFGRSRVKVPTEKISRMRRYPGYLCGRAAWLRAA
jgi:hypothetical protein